MQAHEINANQLHKGRRKILGTNRQCAEAASVLIPGAIVPDALMRPPADAPSSGRIDRTWPRVSLRCMAVSILLRSKHSLNAAAMIGLPLVPRIGYPHLIQA
jgi:hypothetical protein